MRQVSKTMENSFDVYPPDSRPWTAHTSAYSRSIYTSHRSMRRKKLVVVGDGESGKTSLLMMFVHRKFPTVLIYRLNIFADLHSNCVRDIYNYFGRSQT